MAQSGLPGRDLLAAVVGHEGVHIFASITRADSAYLVYVSGTAGAFQMRHSLGTGLMAGVAFHFGLWLRVRLSELIELAPSHRVLRDSPRLGGGLLFTVPDTQPVGGAVPGEPAAGDLFVAGRRASEGGTGEVRNTVAERQATLRAPFIGARGRRGAHDDRARGRWRAVPVCPTAPGGWLPLRDKPLHTVFLWEEIVQLFTLQVKNDWPLRNSL